MDARNSSPSKPPGARDKRNCRLTYLIVYINQVQDALEFGCWLTPTPDLANTDIAFVPALVKSRFFLMASKWLSELLWLFLGGSSKVNCHTVRPAEQSFWRFVLCTYNGITGCMFFFHALRFFSQIKISHPLHGMTELTGSNTEDNFMEGKTSSATRACVVQDTSYYYSSNWTLWDLV